MPMSRTVGLLLFVAGLLVTFSTDSKAAETDSTRTFDMRPHWDATIALANPHKGWYHHFPDNHPDKYLVQSDSDLLDFPGMDHLYIRLAWSYLEPREGKYHWDVIDRWIQKWVAHGLGISFRISCKETSTDRIEQQFATPKWVMETGAEGGYYRKGQRTGPDGPWEPRFDDPVFLEKLENFLKAFAARYDGKPWLRYVDIGSIGDWGEGHTSSGSRLHYGFEPRRRHVDLHCKVFQKTQLVISDDFVYSIADLDERRRMHRYVLDRGIAYRDDSILVDYYVKAYSDTYTVRSPECFADAWQKSPQVLELQHYGAVKKDGNWIVRPGSSAARHGAGKSGADYFRGALKLLHATYIGYHGFAHEWLEDNPELTVELLNRSGYWYFLHGVKTPQVWKPGAPVPLALTWENRGVAPAYEPFQLRVRLKGPSSHDFTLDSGNRKWLPSDDGKTYDEQSALELPEELTPGDYVLALNLYSPVADRDVLLAFKRELRGDDGFYAVGKIRVE